MVRAVALSALVREAPATASVPVWEVAARDVNSRVRLRAAQLAPALGRAVPQAALLVLLADDDAWVAEAAAFALGERPRPGKRATQALVREARENRDPLGREAAVACDDKPAIRRRAVLALAAFEGEDVEARIRAALEDSDWQVRQAAEDLLSE
jgi:HEAT repeat protein